MSKEATAIEVREWGYLVGGEFRSSGKTLEVRSPYDDSLVGITFRPTEKDIEDAVEQARAGFDAMSALPTYQRAEILRRISAGLEAHRDELIRLLALEAGKPRKAGTVEVDRAIFNFRNASEEAQRIENDFVPLDVARLRLRPTSDVAP